MTLSKETKYYRYEIDEANALTVWYKDGETPFLFQPFNPDTGEAFTSPEDAEAFYFSRYGTEETEVNPFPVEEITE